MSLYTAPATSATIVDGSIVDADVNASAAIAGTKIAPDFGAQNVTTTGTSTAASYNPTSATVPTNGIYLPAANSVGISTNGSGRLFVDASGNVGVGTPPSYPFHAAETVAVTSAASYATLFGQGTRADLILRSTSSSNDHQRQVIRSNSDSLIFGTENAAVTTFTEKLRITSAGLVGIGSSAPQGRLESAAGDSTSYAIVANNSYSTGDQNYISLTASTTQIGSINRVTNDIAIKANYAGVSFWTGTGGTATQKAVIDSSGRLGIGNSAPSYTLDVTGTHRNSGIYFNQNDTPQGTAGTITRHSVVGLTTRGITGSVFDWSVYSASGNALITNQTGTNTINFPSGNVTVTGGSLGIGTTAAQSLIHAHNASGNTAITVTNSSTGSSASRGVYFGLDSYDATINLYEGGAIKFATNNTERGRWTSSGQFLVGTSSTVSNTALLIQGNSGAWTNSAGVLRISNSATSPADGASLGFVVFSDGSHGDHAWINCQRDGGTWGTVSKPTRLVFSTTADGAGSPTERMRISNDGGTGVLAYSGTALSLCSNKASGTSDNIIVGTYGATSMYGGTASIAVRTNGNVVNANNSYGSLSDLKLKENIVDAGTQWDDIKALQVRKYNFKEGQTHTQIGLIAQEVELVSPGLVNESPDRDAEGNDLGTVTKSVNYSVLYMKAVKALQEAMLRIEDLEARLDAANL